MGYELGFCLSTTAQQLGSRPPDTRPFPWPLKPSTRLACARQWVPDPLCAQQNLRARWEVGAERTREDAAQRVALEPRQAMQGRALCGTDTMAADEPLEQGVDLKAREEEPLSLRPDKRSWGETW